MAFIDTVSNGEAVGPVAKLYETDRINLGYVANYTRIFAHRPAVYEAWQKLRAAITESMDPRRYELVTLAAARAVRSSYCTLAHGKVLAERFFETASVREIVTDHRSAGLDAVDVAVMDLAETVARDAGAVTQTDVERLRDVGLSDVEIFDVVAAAAARCFFSKVLDALGVEPDASFGTLEPELRDALTVGRPIAEP
ncbi:MAG TPA: peroxidase-related enzyme [Casimicrobiaceae bacterium]